MKTRIQLALLTAVMTLSASFTFAAEDRRPPREAWELVTIQARVEALDLQSRSVTLRGPQGNIVSVEVGPAVKRLDEIAIGDLVTAEYWTYVLAEFRAPTAEEAAEPLVVLAEGAKAPEGFPPGAVIGAVVQAVVTVEIINRPDMLVTVKGPGGDFASFPLADPALITELHAGEVVVLTYAEALALTLEPFTGSME